MTADDYFTDQYARGEDPWGFATHWYERRKRALTLAALPREHYDWVLEPACAIGLLTEGLAPRCDRLVAYDLVPEAVASARHRVGAPHVSIEVGDLREGWPEGRFDLIVLSEVLYYLDEAALVGLVRRLGDHLSADGHVVSVCWRHPVAEHQLLGDRADELLREHCGLAYLGGYRDDDMVLSVLGVRPGSVAAGDGLA